jgi:mannose-1-phosphate guanylyltransferase
MTTPTLEFGMVLCAGLGVRLQPLTQDHPKPLLRFLDRPIASYAMDVLSRAGVSSVGVNGHRFSEQLSEWLAMEARTRGHLTRHVVVDEPSLLGTGGGAAGIWRALDAPRGPVAVLNGDILCDADLDAMLKVHRRTGAAATLLTIPPLSDETAVYVDETARFIAQVPGTNDVWTSPDYAPRHAVTFGGVYLLEPEVFEALPSGVSCLVRQGIGPLLAQGAKVASVPWSGFWADLGTPSRFLEATQAALAQSDALFGPAWQPPSSGVQVHPTATCHPDAEFIGPVLVGPDARVERSATIGPGVVVGTGCRIAQGATVRRSVLMHDAVAEGTMDARIVSGVHRARATLRTSG